MARREYWIDHTKLFACSLVVLGHLLQGLYKAKIKWNEFLYLNINSFICLIHMPIFMFLSGYLYAQYTKISSKQDYAKFIKKKTISLMVPYFCFYVLTIVISMLFSSSVNSKKGLNELLGIFYHPISPYWYLYTLLFIFILIPIIEKIFKNKKKLLFLLMLFLHIYNIFLPSNVYIINSLSFYLIFFFIGTMVDIDKLKKYSKFSLFNLMFFILTSSIVCYLKIINKFFIITGILTLLSSISGIFVFSYIFIKLEKKLKTYKIITFLSKYTFPIFLMHTIFSAGTRIFLLKIGISNFYIHFSLGLLSGILCPILIMQTIGKNHFFQFCVYPNKLIKKN